MFWKKRRIASEGDKLDNNRIWRIIRILNFSGVGMLAMVSIQRYGIEYQDGHVNYNGYNATQVFVTFGTALLMAGACFCLGSLAGFLFGIPRIIENTSDNAPIKSARGEVLHNDNLVQISDWLTKIIVGVGLTQINKVPEFLDQLANYLGPSFAPGEYANHMQVSKAIAICVVLYFLIVGFIACYLWTRFYFAGMLKESLVDNTPEKGKGDVSVNVVNVTDVHTGEMPAKENI
ncbi:MAG: hypothetical protein K0R65_625 [Crocinitomicaceae bacterium]|jgi:hypothetical protein|nr:hypothetical protein [Crocinitomicaceae bacterium]